MVYCVDKSERIAIGGAKWSPTHSGCFWCLCLLFWLFHFWYALLPSIYGSHRASKQASKPTRHDFTIGTVFWLSLSSLSWPDLNFPEHDIIAIMPMAPIPFPSNYCAGVERILSLVTFALNPFLLLNPLPMGTSAVLLTYLGSTVTYILLLALKGQCFGGLLFFLSFSIKPSSDLNEPCFFLLSFWLPSSELQRLGFIKPQTAAGLIHTGI